jgi:Beta-1,3-glucanase
MQYCASSRHGGIRLPWKKSFITLVALSVLIPRIGSSQSGLTVNFINKNPDYGPAQIYVAFGGQSNPAQLVGTIVNGAGLSLGTNYALTDLKTGVHLTRFIGGRICFSLGKPFRSMKPGNANNPNFNNPSLPDFNIRWDKAEITYDVGDPHSGINLSATDFFSVRLKIQTYHAGSLVTTLTWQAPIATIFHNTGLLTGFSRDAVCSDDKNGVPTEGLTPRDIIKVVRVIAPSTIPAAVVNPYPSLHPYIDHVKANAITTTIQGTFNTVTTYKFTAMIDSAGALVMTGTITTNSVPQSHVIVIRSSELERGIYTADPLCNVDGVDKHVGNDAFGATVRDVLAGFSLGFIGSKEQNPNAPGQTFGNSPSYQWYTPNKLPTKYAFQGAQPEHTFYNQYAAYLATVTDAYGFPFTDLTQSPFASLKPGNIDRMDITVLPDN